MSSIFILKKEPPKNDRYFVIGGSIDMNVGVF